MEAILIQFIQTLRNAEVTVSPAESIDAVNAVALVGYEHRALLHDTLASVLAKSEFEKQRFNQCFEQFFKLDPFNWNESSTANNNDASEIEGEGSWDSEALSGEADDGGDGDASGDAGDGSAGESNQGQEALNSDDIASSIAELLASGAVDIERSAGASANNESSAEQDQLAGTQSNTSDALLANMVQAILTNDQVMLAMQLQAAAAANQLQGIRYSTQRSLYRYRILLSLQANRIEQVIQALQQGTSAAQQQAGDLRIGLASLREQVTDYVDQQLYLNADAATRELREDILQNANLSRIEQRHFETMQTLVHKMSKSLVARYARRRRVKRRGQLDIAKTIRHNISHDGVLFDTYWKLKKKERPELFAICDVSGSVAAYSRFLLLFLYSLADVLPKARSFAFSSNLGEVTELFREHPPARAIELVNREWGYGSSSYGDSLRDFADLALDDLRPNSTVIILGDGRNNGGNPELEILRKIYQRCACVIWLNPESKGSWSVGDSEMDKYLTAVHYSNSCQSLRHLETVISELLRRSS